MQARITHLCCPVWTLNPVCAGRSWEHSSTCHWRWTGWNFSIYPESKFWHSLVYGKHSSVIFLWNHTAVKCGYSCFFSSALSSVHRDASIRGFAAYAIFSFMWKKYQPVEGLWDSTESLFLSHLGSLSYPSQEMNTLADTTREGYIVFCLPSKCRNVGCSGRWRLHVNLQRLMHYQ